LTQRAHIRHAFTILKKSVGKEASISPFYMFPSSLDRTSCKESQMIQVPGHGKIFWLELLKYVWQSSTMYPAVEAGASIIASRTSTTKE
jgi:hypothetical protein